MPSSIFKNVNVSPLTACEAIISLMLCSYCSARMASLRVCSSFRALSTVLCSALGVTSIWWWRRALYCLVCTLHVSWNCFLICSSKAWWWGQRQAEKREDVDLRHRISAATGYRFNIAQGKNLSSGLYHPQKLMTPKLHSSCITVLLKIFPRCKMLLMACTMLETYPIDVSKGTRKNAFRLIFHCQPCLSSTYVLMTISTTASRILDRLTLRFLGCCRSSRTCLRWSSRSRRLLYSIWFSSSVWCCRRIRSIRSFCSVFSCLCSSSCMDSSWRISMACSISFWVFFLFSS